MIPGFLLNKWAFLEKHQGRTGHGEKFLPAKKIRVSDQTRSQAQRQDDSSSDTKYLLANPGVFSFRDRVTIDNRIYRVMRIYGSVRQVTADYDQITLERWT